MKLQIANLCRFFKANGATVDAVVKYNVQPFIDDITAIANDPTAKEYSIAAYNYTDSTRTLKMDELQDWTQKAQDHITQVAAKKRAEIMDKMGVRIKNIEATTKMLQSAPAVEGAIEEGTQAATQADEDETTHNAAASPLKGFSMNI
ncbi:hypothetical protein THAR02_04116 [Trichoderma harzianum]|uniref:Uncharacterized protein n=1 Tax=Trichoderma harzianum TaxID=5544 RepID=A0A0F9XFC0_TRIHA|nr:hypothetical protein THAR02_04116 [Trichoderma harzianum]